MSDPLVVVDADALGRRRTGDETYVEGLLGALSRQAAGLRIAAVTRRPELVPDGIESLRLDARSQELRMALSLPRLLRRVRPALAHFLHALPLACPCPTVVTVQDLSFERDPSVLRPWERLVFRTVVPRAARRAARVLAISERTKRDVVELYGVPSERVVVTPLGVDAAFRPGDAPDAYVLLVGAIERRKNPLAAAAAAREVGRPLVAVGPVRDRALARELEEAGAELRGYVEKDELARLYQGAACLVFPSRYEGFGLPVVEAMASGTPVVAAPDAALREVAGDAAVFAAPDELAAGIRTALAERERLVAAGFERARAFTWDETARRTLAVYHELLG
ncbi:MAG TPA: glycosyltransferase family 1 protein [Gaiellaceae bacterium]